MAFLFFTLESRACKRLSSMTVLSRPTYSDVRVAFGKQLSEIQRWVATVGVGQDGHAMPQQCAWARRLLRCKTSRIQKCFTAHYQLTSWQRTATSLHLVHGVCHFEKSNARHWPTMVAPPLASAPLALSLGAPPLRASTPVLLPVAIPRAS